MGRFYPRRDDHDDCPFCRSVSTSNIVWSLYLHTILLGQHIEWNNRFYKKVKTAILPSFLKFGSEACVRE